MDRRYACTRPDERGALANRAALAGFCDRDDNGLVPSPRPTGDGGTLNAGARKIQRVYLTLTLGNTLAASFIWGINTLFLLDAGLSNFEAFAANAFFTAGMVLFEVPTGVVADGWGRRTSFLLGTLTLAGSTYLYYMLWQLSAPFWSWAVVSVLLGLGFTFFSGAVEAWLVDALRFAGYEGGLEAVLGRGLMVQGAAMLLGSVAGGVVAQATDLGVPFLLRVGVLVAMFLVAFWLMHDVGFTPERSAHPLRATRAVLSASIESGLKNPPVRYVMLAAPFSSGVAIYVFYALQPYLLGLFGDPDAYSIAGLAAALVAGAEILGGWVAPRVRRLVRKRTTVLMLSSSVSAAILLALGFIQVFWAALVLLALWALVAAAGTPVRQAYLNDMIASKQRATVLSFDSLMGSSGGVVVQPALGRAADVYGYPASLAVSGLIELMAVPFLLASRQQRHRADDFSGATDTTDAESPPLQES
jgi:MFS family permease